MKKPEIGQITEIIANGHAFGKHVLGTAPDSHYPGQNTFRMPELGPDLGIETKADLNNYIKDFLGKDGTEGFAQKPGQYLFYNKADNVLLSFNLNDSKGDFGSIYRPNDFRTTFNRDLRQARFDAPGKVHLAKTPNEITNLTNKFVKDILHTPHAKATFLSKLDDLGKNGGFFIGVGVGGTLAVQHLLDGNPAHAAESFVDIAVPYGETIRHTAQMNPELAVRSAIIETASNVGCIAVGGLSGSGVTYFTGGTAVPAGLTVAASTSGCLVGGLVVGETTAFVYDGYQTISDKIADLFNDVVDEFPPETLNLATLDSDTAHALLPDTIQPGMPPEVESLVLVKPNPEQFNAQFEEIKDYGGLPNVETYLNEQACTTPEHQIGLETSSTPVQLHQRNMSLLVPGQ